MKQVKTIELTGYELIDSKLIAGYGLFDLVDNDPSNSILQNLYDLEKTDLKLAKSILCKRFHYRELRFAEDIFVTTGANPPLTLTTDSKKYNVERNFLNKYLYDDKRHLEHVKDYFLMLKFAIIGKQLDTVSPLIKQLMAMTLVVVSIALLAYPFIGNNTIIVMIIITYASINLVKNVTTLAELELEDFNSYYQ